MVSCTPRPTPKACSDSLRLKPAPPCRTAEGSIMSDSATTEPRIFKGLAGVMVDITAISMVNSDTNSLLYRGYPVQQLAARCSVEQVALLLWNGELPSPETLAEFELEERSSRALATKVLRAIDDIPLTTHPMD